MTGTRPSDGRDADDAAARTRPAEPPTLRWTLPQPTRGAADDAACASTGRRTSGRRRAPVGLAMPTAPRVRPGDTAVGTAPTAAPRADRRRRSGRGRARTSARAAVGRRVRATRPRVRCPAVTADVPVGRPARAGGHRPVEPDPRARHARPRPIARPASHRRDECSARGPSAAESRPPARRSCSPCMRRTRPDTLPTPRVRDVARRRGPTTESVAPSPRSRTTARETTDHRNGGPSAQAETGCSAAVDGPGGWLNSIQPVPERPSAASKRAMARGKRASAPSGDSSSTGDQASGVTVIGQARPPRARRWWGCPRRRGSARTVNSIDQVEAAAELDRRAAT